jgi:hypothetical protein
MKIGGIFLTKISLTMDKRKDWLGVLQPTFGGLCCAVARSGISGGGSYPCEGTHVPRRMVT